MLQKFRIYSKTFVASRRRKLKKIIFAKQSTKQVSKPDKNYDPNTLDPGSLEDAKRDF